MVQEGQNFLFARGRNNTSITIDEVGEGERESAFDTSPEAGEVALSDPPPGLRDDLGPGNTIGVGELRDEIDPTAIHRRRSDAAKEADAAKDAQVTTDPLQWASNPDHFDFPGVDTGPMFEDTFGSRDPETLQRRDDSFFDF